MAPPSWPAEAFAAIMLVIAVYCAARLLTSWLKRREIELDADVVHLLMGLSMAGMLISRLNPIPNSVWETAFAAATLWFTARTIRAWRGTAATGWRCPHPLPHLVENGAMLYMLLATRNPATSTGAQGMAMPGMGSGTAGMARFPTLAFLLAIFMVGYVVWLGDRFSLAGRGSAGAAAPHAGHTLAQSSAALRQDTATDAQAPANDLLRCPSPSAGATILAPRIAGCYKIAMGITMGYMLITML